LKVSGQTVREVMRVSLGGDRLRVRFSNAFGTAPVALGSVRIGLHGSGSAVTSSRELRFGGASSVTLPAGGAVVSDPVALSVAALSEIVVSLYLPGAVTVMTEHASAHETTYISAPGDATGTGTLPEGKATESWYLLAGVDVEREGGQAVVAIGDSLTDGDRSTRDANHRWTDRLAERLNGGRGVVNEGMSGNRLLHDHDSFGKSALARFDADVLGQPGARYVVVAEGLNDIGMPGAFDLPGETVTAEQIIQAHQQLIERARARGLRVYGATMSPYEGVAFKGYYTAEGEAKRQAVNAWLRSSKAYDALLDFDAVLRDPEHPARLNPAFASVDHIHPNDAGYRAMGDAVNLALFDDGAP
jgi:lysophospholipase L1-like esterase